jgi:hypothetical protein
MKLTNVFTVLIFFVLISLLLMASFILRSFHYCKTRKLEFYDKSNNSFRGTLYFMVEFGLFSLLLGSVHILAEKTPNLQLGLLAIIEVGFIIFNLFNLSRKYNVFHSKFQIWVGIYASFLRLKLFSSFFIFKSQH